MQPSSTLPRHGYKDGREAFTIIDGAEALEPRGRAIDDETTTTWVLTDIVDREGRCVDCTFEIDIKHDAVWLLRISVVVKLDSIDVVGLWPDSRVGEDVVDLAMEFYGLLEEPNQLLPFRYVGLVEGELWRAHRALCGLAQVGTNYGRA